MRRRRTCAAGRHSRSGRWPRNRRSRAWRRPPPGGILRRLETAELASGQAAGRSPVGSPPPARLRRPAADRRAVSDRETSMAAAQRPIEMYYWPTPNGWKISIMLEECGLPYVVRPLNIAAGEQFTQEFLAISPNNRMPAIVEHDGPGGKPISVFESGAILVYLAETFGAFLPTEPAARAECLSWLFWQVGSGPMLGGGFGHFYAYAPVKIEYAIDRFAMEVKRQLDVLDRRLGESRYVAGDDYTIAYMAIWPWYGAVVTNQAYNAAEFLSADEYRNVRRWTDEIAARPAVQRGRMVNRVMGDPASQLHERHDASDFETRTQDKLVAADA
ncbi:MAG: glutathione-dependent disulfide-bond oxidoreductase [Methylobacteriaceae bacterium]|nr:glutathione-dependent disulfide-bond oxidoreductase [Methylobacteriaceae bacterium]